MAEGVPVKQETFIPTRKRKMHKKHAGKQIEERINS